MDFQQICRSIHQATHQYLSQVAPRQSLPSLLFFQLQIQLVLVMNHPLLIHCLQNFSHRSQLKHCQVLSLHLCLVLQLTHHRPQQISYLSRLDQQLQHPLQTLL